MFSLDNLKEEIFRILGIDAVIRSFSDYIESRINLVKMEVREEISRHLSRFMVAAIILLLFFMAFGFLSLTAGLYLNEVTGSSWKGFLILGGVYLVVAFMVLLFRSSLSRSVQQKMKERMGRES